MPETDTPEVDSLINRLADELQIIALARSLERERNAARKERDALKAVAEQLAIIADNYAIDLECDSRPIQAEQLRKTIAECRQKFPA